ncbi:winged helix-turn-helix domain-containing protein [Halomarina halobia]|uniref:Winged helix-turn-helix domain-containing protein n=1 Tax=Halomarina halobia TaxID=3033386 RepID=A0ABD6A828_9EURY|nr:winged helix-turn-helix domain-containing protein [Halomarina sp. PSR21]
MTDEQPVEEILDTIGDRKARLVLAEISRQPRSAKELSELCGLSLPTIYRRLDMLKEHDLIVGLTTIVEGGNHYERYQCNFNSTLISLEDSEYDVKIYREENLPDRFSELWDDLQRA